MNLCEKIFEELWDSQLKYKGMRVNFFGIPRFDNYSKNSIYISLHRLKKKGYVDSDKSSNSWCLTKEGKYYLREKYKTKPLPVFDFESQKDKPKNLILMFDIPQEQKYKREWLRLHLRKLNFIMIQKSVWVGPYPLPKEFSDYIKTIKINSMIKSFRLARSYRK